MFVARIHNNSLGSCTPVDNWEAGVQLVKTLSEEQLERELDQDETDALENEGHVFSEDDADNIWCISIGMLDGE